MVHLISFIDPTDNLIVDEFSLLLDPLSDPRIINLFEEKLLCWRRNNKFYIFEKKDEDNVIVFLLRCEFDYRTYRSNKRQLSNGTWLDDNKLNSDQTNKLKIYVKEVLAIQDESNQLEDLPEEIVQWLHIRPEISKATVFETELWIRAISQFPSDYLQRLYHLISQIFCDRNTQNVELKNFDSERKITIAKETEFTGNAISIAYEEINFEADTFFILYLSTINEINNSDIDIIRKEYGDHKIDNKNCLPEIAKRAYPDWALYEYTTWKVIQGKEISESNVVNANIALSPEEEQLLQEAKFPFFLNGQAGSGKSTMLYYLFAHFVTIKYKHEKTKELKQLNGNPAFFTYSENLVKTGREAVKVIIRSNPDFRHLHNGGIESGDIDNYFHSFQDYILKNLTSTEDKVRFGQKKLTLSLFKKYYSNQGEIQSLNCKLPERNRFSPELVWYVIRTFIKGFSAENFLDSEGYSNFTNRDDIVVTKETYKEIYNIWEKWYRNLEETFWDDQDCVRAALKYIKSTDDYTRFPVIFCDEAQDFTRIEIELIYKLSSFSKYKLNNNHYSIPFAFAGDPFQTLNPTGFRWEAMSAAFSSKFKELGQSSIKLNFKNLTYNYRSRKSIVHFANFIQMFRYLYLGCKTLKPQIPWGKSQGSKAPLYFNIPEGEGTEHVIEALSKNNVIIPADDEYGEIEFSKNDANIKKNILHEFNSSQQIVSPATVKGQEFPKSIVYKFGEYVPKSFYKILEDYPDGVTNIRDLDENEYLELSHFFNKLYVAITRPMEALFTVENDTGIKFWQSFSNDGIMINKVNKTNGIWSQNDITFIEKGTQTNAEEIGEDIHPERYFIEGVRTKNISHLNRAAAIYYSQGLVGNSDLAKAFYHYFQDKWKEAGSSFTNLSNSGASRELYNFLKSKESEIQIAIKPFNVSAIECFWKGGLWGELYQILPEGHIKKVISAYMLNKTGLTTIIEEKQEIWDARSDETIWSNIWDHIFEDINRKIENAESSSKISINIADFATGVATRTSDNRFYDLAAKIYNIHDNFESAVLCWEEGEFTSTKEYFNAKAEIEPDPNEKIELWEKSKNDIKLEKFYVESNSRKIQLNTKSNETIVISFFRQKKFTEAFEVPASLNFKIVNAIYHTKEVADYSLILSKILENKGNAGLLIGNNSQWHKSILRRQNMVSIYKYILAETDWKKPLNDILNIMEKELDRPFINNIQEIITVCSTDIKLISADLILFINAKLRDRYDTNKIEDIQTIYELLAKLISMSLIEPKDFKRDGKQLLNNILDNINTRNITPYILGAVYERTTDYYKDILEYYNYYISNNDLPDQILELIKLRWLVVANKRAKYEQEKGIGNIDYWPNIINQKLGEWNISKAIFQIEPEFPEHFNI